MSGRASGAGGRNGGHGTRRLTHAETLKRQKEIAYLRDVERLTWVQISERIGMGPKEAAESYARYVEEIVPLLISAPAEGKAAELLGNLDEIHQLLLQIATSSANESARVGALRDAAKSVVEEFRIRRTLGLLPALDGDAEMRSIAQQIAEVLDRHGVPDAVSEEIERILTDQGKGSEP